VEVDEIFHVALRYLATVTIRPDPIVRRLFSHRLTQVDPKLDRGVHKTDLNISELFLNTRECTFLIALLRELTFSIGFPQLRNLTVSTGAMMRESV
jgi:hypothetical protein